MVPSEKKVVYIILYPGCISFEVTLAAELLSKTFRVVNATPEGQDLEEVSGLALKSQASYAQVDLKNCIAILVPGGDPGSVVDNKEIEDILIAACQRAIWIGAVCAGPSLLGKAGILKGRRIAHGYAPHQMEFLKDIFEGATLTDELFVADGKVLTARPEAHIEFAVEMACRLGVADASRATKLKEYYRGTLGRNIRPLALALIRNEHGQILVSRSFDSVKKEFFYRPLGGGIEFHETGDRAVVREIREELGLAIQAGPLIKTLENVFIHEGKRGHEIVFLYEAQFTDRASYRRTEMDIVESGRVVGKAMWRSPDEIRAEGARLYPEGLPSL